MDSVEHFLITIQIVLGIILLIMLIISWILDIDPFTNDEYDN
jgi:hypothetical protein